ncbi:MAG: hypothetical protein V1915_02330 [Candidatus Bathyarchaeota archaeon]
MSTLILSIQVFSLASSSDVSRNSLGESGVNVLMKGGPTDVRPQKLKKKGAEEVLVSSSADSRRANKNRSIGKLIQSLNNINPLKLSSDTLIDYSR